MAESRQEEYIIEPEQEDSVIYYEPTASEEPAPKKKKAFTRFLEGAGNKYKEYRAKAPEREEARSKRLDYDISIAAKRAKLARLQSSTTISRSRAATARSKAMGSLNIGLGSGSFGTMPKMPSLMGTGFGKIPTMGSPKKRKAKRHRKKAKYKTVRVRI